MIWDIVFFVLLMFLQSKKKLCLFLFSSSTSFGSVGFFSCLLTRQLSRSDIVLLVLLCFAAVHRLC